VISGELNLSAFFSH